MSTSVQQHIHELTENVIVQQTARLKNEMVFSIALYNVHQESFSSDHRWYTQHGWETKESC